MHKIQMLDKGVKFGVRLLLKEDCLLVSVFAHILFHIRLNFDCLFLMAFCALNWTFKGIDVFGVGKGSVRKGVICGCSCRIERSLARVKVFIFGSSFLLPLVPPLYFVKNCQNFGFKSEYFARSLLSFVRDRISGQSDFIFVVLFQESRCLFWNVFGGFRSFVSSIYFWSLLIQIWIVEYMFRHVNGEVRRGFSGHMRVKVEERRHIVYLSLSVVWK